jgi:hypothetical protein
VYGDFNLTADRLLFIDGSADVWRDLCYHSNSAPQRYWTDLHPEHLINGAGHVWDLRALDDYVDDAVHPRDHAPGDSHRGEVAEGVPELEAG